MDYLLQYTDLPRLHILIALAMAVVGAALKSKKSFCLGILSGWLFLTLSSTVLSRQPFIGQHLELHLFWSYRAGSHELLMENLMNIFLLMPVGILMPALGAPLGATAAFGAGWSALIETLQLVTERGLFEFDDIVHNTVGVVVGYLIFMGVKRGWKKIKQYRV